jgi:hypothetical protein
MYFKGRLRTKELFLIRSDEKFFVKTGNNNTRKSFSDNFRTDYIEDLVYGNFYYTDLPEDCKGNPDSKEVMRFLRTF